MLARLIGMLLGLALGGAGYAILNPGGLSGRIPVLHLGPFEPLKLFVAAAAAGLGLVIFVAALMPKGPKGGGSSGGGSGSKKRKHGPPITVDFNAPPAATAPDTDGRPHARLTAMPDPPPVRAGAPPGVESFAEARATLHSLTHSENWPQAAAQSRRLSSLATTPAEQMIAAQDAGDFARSQGQHDDAWDAYETALAHARETNDPAALAGALTNIGDMAYDQQRLEPAVSAYEEALALRRKLTSASPADPIARRALSLSLERLADAREDRGHRMRALDLYRESLTHSQDLAALHPTRFGPDLEVTLRRIAELEARTAF